MDYLKAVLSPLIYVLYVNELPSTPESSMLICADNVKLWQEMTGDADTCALQTDLNIVISLSEE